MWRAVAVAFLLQVLAIGLLHTYRIRATDNHFGFGWEMGCVGRAIASGRGFSDPYCAGTGPTAWEPPLYPYLIGGVFKLFGTYTAASAWVLLTINSLFSALTCIPIYLVARRLADERVARWSAWAWALLPYVWYWSIHWVWDTTITPFVLSLIFLISLDLAEVRPPDSSVPEGKRDSRYPDFIDAQLQRECRRSNAPVPEGQHESRPGFQPPAASGNEASPGGTAALPRWILFGALWGVGALMNPSMLSFLPFCGLWIWYQRHKRGLPSFAGVVLASAIFFLCLSPWLVRNYNVFGRFVFIRDDFGEQFRLGNGPGADGILMAYLQPNLNSDELERFRSMGELPYAEVRKREAFAWVREEPRRFAAISVRRFVYYWAGVPKRSDSAFFAAIKNLPFLISSVLAIWGLVRALRQRKPGASLFALLVLSYPTVYYFVFPHARYRHPIEPELIILIAYVIATWLPTRAELEERGA